MSADTVQKTAVDQLGIDLTDIDAAINWWDDPMGIGFATAHMPWAQTNQSAMTASRAVFARCISGGLVNFLRFNVFTASGNMDIAIYANTGKGAAARPGARRWSTGSFAVPAPAGAPGNVVAVPGIVVRARQDWLAFSVDNATASFYQMVVANQEMEQQAGWACFKDTTFPLPDPAGGSLRMGYFRMPSMAGRRT